MTAVDKLACFIEQHRRLGDARLRRALEQADSRDGLPLFGEVKASRTATRAAEVLLQMHTRLLLLHSDDYPKRLVEALADDTPPVLYASGNLQLLKHKCFAIIGTRRPSGAGRRAAQAYANALVARGFDIVSGNAPGIDSAAHEAALRSGGSTIVFPPAPLEQFSPNFDVPAHSDRMLVLSPFCPGSAIEPYCFLRRNSLVAALCIGALVAETGTRGGTLDTVKKLRAFDRPLWATKVPPGAKHSNAHQLLIAGGAMATPCLPSARDISAVVAHTERGERKKARTHLQFSFGDLG